MSASKFVNIKQKIYLRVIINNNYNNNNSNNSNKTKPHKPKKILIYSYKQYGQQK